MEQTAHIVADISGHGLGHLGQTAPVLNALLAKLPQARLTVRTSLPEAVIGRRLSVPFRYRNIPLDVGMRMSDATQVDVSASIAAYRDFHCDWESRVRAAIAQLHALSPSLIFSNVAYLGLAAAARLGIPAVALCCLNWADIYQHFCGDQPDAARIHQQIMDAYCGATMFLTPVPTMSMSHLPNARKIGPVGQSGRNRRSGLNRLFGLKPRDKLVLLSFGGIAFDLPIETWPETPGFHFVVPAGWQPRRRDFITHESTGLPQVDLIASCDAFVTKPGYASFVEAATCGIPVLYVKRKVWPEQDCLIEWLRSRGHCYELGESQLRSGAFMGEVNELISRERAASLVPSGNNEAVQCILEVLQAQGIQES